MLARVSFFLILYITIVWCRHWSWVWQTLMARLWFVWTGKSTIPAECNAYPVWGLAGIPLMYFLEVTRQISGESNATILQRSCKQAFAQYDLETVDKNSASWNVPCLFPFLLLPLYWRGRIFLNRIWKANSSQKLGAVRDRDIHSLFFYSLNFSCFSFHI